MPTNKRRTRQGNNSSKKLHPNPNSLIIPSKNNSIGNGNNIHLNHHMKHSPVDDGITSNGTISTFTLKQQQQLDRNAYLLTLTKDQLKAECRKRGQKSNGTKTELLQRVGFKMSLQQQQQKVLNNGGTQRSPAKPKTTVNGSATTQTKIKTDKDRKGIEREKVVLWCHPMITLKYCGLEIIELLRTYGAKLIGNKLLIAIIIALVTVLSALYNVPGNHQIVVTAIRANLWFALYWIGLGVLSSVGLGTGLHTFLLYLGPHIAKVTLAAYECNSLDFPSPPYPDEIVCPQEVADGYIPSLWSIMSKVRWEAFLWGAGTALGELPPYFMAKASRLSGIDPDDEDDELKEFEELNKKSELGVELSIMERAKIFMERAVEKVGFLGILACASIPNPLFDLAGITCGHFLVPFWTFFGATLLGKAVIKMHIQKVFVIIAFSETLVEKAVDVLGNLPWIGKRLQVPFKAFLQDQKSRLHRSAEKPLKESKNLIARLFEYFVVVMIIYFVLSIVNSLAQSYHKRINRKSNKNQRKQQ